MIEVQSRWSPRLDAKLYVDDLTLSAYGKARSLVALLDSVLQFVVHTLQDELLSHKSLRSNDARARRGAEYSMSHRSQDVRD